MITTVFGSESVSMRQQVFLSPLHMICDHGIGGLRFSMVLAAVSILLLIGPSAAFAGPIVFWTSEPVSPGEVVMLYGGDLQDVRSVFISRLHDGPAGEPSPTRLLAADTKAVEAAALQPSNVSLTFILPKTLQPGVFVLNYGGRPVLIDAPEIEWCQPTKLLPGLSKNEAAPGSTIQIIGRNFLLTPESAGSVRVTLRSNDGRIVPLSVSRPDKYSITARLPVSLAAGKYQIWVHNGNGGSNGWGGGLVLNVKAPAMWPATVFNVKTYGARGDDVADDSGAFRSALNAANRNGGGVVYFPAGVYRLDGWFFIPKRIVVRGETRGLTFLKWPEIAPASISAFIPAVLYSSGEFGIENLTLVAANTQTILLDLSWDAFQSGKAPVPALQKYLTQPGTERNVFLRNVDFQLLYYASRSANPAADPRWSLNGFGWKNGELVKVIALEGIHNLEISGCRFVGGTQRMLDVVNARFINNRFDNQWAILSWTDLGGQYVIFQNNVLNGASGWRAGLLAIRHIYCAYNRSNNIVSGEREALTFDVDGVLGRQTPTEWKGHKLPVVKPWIGRIASDNGATVRLEDAHLPPHAYHGLDLLVLAGRGAGQYRRISDNTENSITVSTPWTVDPGPTSAALAFQLPGRSIFYRNQAEDTSVLLQIWGYLYDCTFDGNRVVRSQGMWGLSGWFIQWINNDLQVAISYHQGVGPSGDRAEVTPEGGAPYGLMGFVITGTLTSEPLPFPYVRACVIRGNHLSFGQRVLIMFGYGGPRRKAPHVAARDVIVDHNAIDHASVGIELDANVAGAVINDNRFTGVTEPLRLADPTRVRVIQSK